MKNIENFKSSKYADSNYVEVLPDIYKVNDRKNQDESCLSFVEAEAAEAEDVRGLTGWRFNTDYEMYEFCHRGKMYFKNTDCESETIMVFDEEQEAIFVTSLSFIQEPELREGKNASDISQYPLEDILDEYSCWISDFYEDLNTAAIDTCRLEFASSDIEDIQKLREIIGKHVFNRSDQLIIE